MGRPRDPHPCTCHQSVLTRDDLPMLVHRGQQPSWDQYLATVYGNEVQYPVHLNSFEWFFRCDCHVLDRHCNHSNAACADAAHDWKASCRMQASAPFTHAVLPKVWLADHARPSCTRATREAYVGVHIADLATRVRLHPSWRSWPNPEFRLAPYGVWIHPRPLPACQPSNTWIEVIRLRELYEANDPFTWYYHAPGSGIWLNTGKTACIADKQRDGNWFPQSATRNFLANSSSLASHGFVHQPGLFASVNARQHRRDASFDTLQRNGPYGNMLEIVDLRPEAVQRCARSGGCTCTSVLRAGWRASRPCRCDNKLDVLNCAAA